MTSTSAIAGSTPAHLDPSALGSKEYWDKAYDRELINYQDNPEDEGTIWFDDSGAEEKMIAYLEDLDIDRDPQNMGSTDDKSLRILDLGTGNGHLLFALRDEGWEAQMIGVDYSLKSIELAKQIQTQRCVTENADETEESGSLTLSSPIEFLVWDLLQDSTPPELKDGFDIVLDKGTFDAISLNNEPVIGDGRVGCEIYGERIQPLIKPNGFFLITSCNWTANELRKWFERPETGLNYHGSIAYKSFTFGGVKGQSVSSVCFRRKAKQST